MQNRRQFIAQKLTVALLVVLGLPRQVKSETSKAKYRRVQWRKLQNEPVTPGDMWASFDPNEPERQGQDCFNLRMQAIHPSNYGTPACRIGHGNGDYWRPVELVVVT